MNVTFLLKPGRAIDLYSRVNLYRLVAALTVALVLILVLKTVHNPREVRMRDPWTYVLAIENFARGQWVVTGDELSDGRMQIRLLGGMGDVMYANVGEDRWALRKAPGYPLLAVPFHWLGQARLANAVLAVLAAWVVYQLLAAWRDEWAACLGVIVLLWSPISLLALRYSSMSTFADGALPAIGGGLALLYGLRPVTGRRSPVPLLFLAGLAAGWAVASRLPNAPLPVLIGLYLVVTIWNRRPAIGPAAWLHLGAFGLGCVLALAGLAWYNQAVFGHPLDTGYRYDSPYQEHFLWEAEAARELDGTPTWLADGSLAAIGAALFNHLGRWVQPLLLGWPLLPLALLGLILALGRLALPLPAWLAGLWLLAVYAPYAGLVYFGVTRELAMPYVQGWGFYAVDRYLFPAWLPVTMLAAGLLAQAPRRLALGLVLVSAVGSAWLYFQVLTAR